MNLIVGWLVDKQTTTLALMSTKHLFQLDLLAYTFDLHANGPAIEDSHNSAMCYNKEPRITRHWSKQIVEL